MGTTSNPKKLTSTEPHRTSLSTFIHHLFARAFRAYGRFVAKCPWILITITLITCALGLIGLRNFHRVEDVLAQFTPAGARSLSERHLYTEFYQSLEPKRYSDGDMNEGQNGVLNDEPVFGHGQLTSGAASSPSNTIRLRKDTSGGDTIWMKHLQMNIVAADGGSILRPEYITLVQQFTDFIRTGIRDKETNKVYMDLCNDWCPVNALRDTFLELYSNNVTRNSPDFRLEYPVMRMFDASRPVDFLFGVETDEKQTIKGAKMITYSWPLFTKAHLDLVVYIRWRAKLDQILQLTNDTRPFPQLIATFMSEELMAGELFRSGMSIAPYLGAAVLALCVFTIATAMRPEWMHSKPFLCILGIFIPLFGCVVALGILFGVGIPFMATMSVALYLVLAVGVDDLYLIVHCWHRAGHMAHIRHDPIKRMGQCIADAGPSITITSLTNILSFSIGLLSDVAIVRSFCLTAAFAMFVGYVMQLTVFAPCVVLAGRMEIRREIRVNERFENEKKVPKHGVYYEAIMSVQEFYGRFIHWLSHIYVSTLARICTWVFLVVYISFSVYGITRSQIDLRIENMLLPDTPFYRHFVLERQLSASGLHPVTIFFQNPGDLRNRTRFRAALDLIDKLERMEHMLGPSSSTCWIQPYMSYTAFRTGALFSDADYTNREIDADFTYLYIDEFLRTGSNLIFEAYIRGHRDACESDSPDCIHRFKCETGYIRSHDYRVNIDMMRAWRQLADTLPELNVTIAYIHNSLFDQLSFVWPTTWRTVSTTFMAMLIVCAVFVPSVLNVICAAGCVLSINIGVYGLATLWGVDLDPIMTGALLASIGFSVDYIAHITYHYYCTNAKATIAARLEQALLSIGFPMIQAGVSSILCSISMLTHPAYFVVMFAKIMLLVIMSGLVHGLVIMPVLLGALTAITNRFR